VVIEGGFHHVHNRAASGETVFADHSEIVKRLKNPLLDVDDSLLCSGDTALRFSARTRMS